MAGVCG